MLQVYVKELWYGRLAGNHGAFKCCSVEVPYDQRGASRECVNWMTFLSCDKGSQTR